MEKFECPSCNASLSKDNLTCPACNAEIDWENGQPSISSAGSALGRVAIVTILAIGAAAVVLTLLVIWLVKTSWYFSLIGMVVNKKVRNSNKCLFCIAPFYTVAVGHKCKAKIFQERIKKWRRIFKWRSGKIDCYLFEAKFFFVAYFMKFRSGFWKSNVYVFKYWLHIKK